MDRQQVYPGAVPLETDLLNGERNTMVALAKLAAGVFGTSGFINGLTVAPNSPAALNVVVSAGEFYSLQNLDGTAFSSLAADTTHQILKQGILLDPVIPGTPAPATAGQSVVYLIQAAVSESDTTPVVLPYYNASNPALAYSGPAGAGTTNNTKRQCVITLQAKAGIAAVTGSQTTPAPDAGYTGLYAVTVANGQTTVTAANIIVLATAPYLGNAALLNAANVFTQTPSAPTAAAGDNSNKLASTAFVQAFAGGRKSNFIASGSFVVPAGVAQIYVTAVSGGGGGGGGAGCPNFSSTLSAGGGGGGGVGLQVVRTVVTVIPLETLTVTVGAGGNGGAGGTGAANGVTGTNGGNTTLLRSATQLVVIGGGIGGVGSTTPAGSVNLSAGGAGGANGGTQGAAGIYINATGASGTLGGAGGNGAPSLYGPGGIGGQTVGVSSNGAAAGPISSTSFGAGGGGGGGGATGVSTGVFTGGTGGNGGNGYMTIEY